MRILFNTILSFLLLCSPLWAATKLSDEGVSQGYINELDCVGAGISCSRSGIEGTLTVTGGGAGSGDSVTVNGVAVDTTANFLDNTVIEFDIADGGPGGPDDVTGTIAANGVDDTMIDFGTGANQVAAADIPMAIIAGATFSTVQEMQNIFHSAGWVSGGGITDDADGTITVAAGTGLIRATDGATAEILFFDWSAESGANVNLADTDTSWVYIEYNGGSPQVVATTTERTDFNTNVLLAVIYRDGTTLEISDSDKHLIGDHANNMIRRLKDTSAYGRKSGGIISETGTINIAFTAGEFWRGLTEFSTSAINTAVSDTFSYYYNNGTWQKVATQTDIDATQYNNFGVGLATLSNNKYGVHWVYLESDDDDIAIVYGIGDYTLSEAENAQPPSSVPEFLNVIGILAGKIIIKKSDSAFTQIESAFETTFQGSLASDHGGLAGLGDDDHTQYALLLGRSGGQTLIGGTGAGDDLLLQSTSNGTKGLIGFTSLSSGLIWDGVNERLSIGGPENEKTIGGVTKGSIFTTHSQGGMNAYDILFSRHSNSSGPFLIGARSRGSEASPTVVLDGNNMLDIFGCAYDGTDYECAAAILFDVDETTPSSNVMGGKIRFQTAAAGGTTLANALTLNNAKQATFSGIIADNDDMVFEVDANDDGSNSYIWTDGASTQIAILDEAGAFQIADDMIVSGGDITFGNIAARIGDGVTDSITLNTDGTGPGEIVLPDDSINDDEIDNAADVMSASFGITIDGGGSAISTGIKGYIEIPYAMTIDRATFLCDQSGSIVVDVWKDTYANYPPTNADSITSSTPPTISGATKSEDVTLTSWTTSVASGDVIGFNVDSITTVERCHLIISGNKT